MAGRNHDAAGRLLVPYAERKLRRAAIALQEVNAEAVRDHDLRTQSRKVLGAVARIVGNRTGQLGIWAVIIPDVGCEALSALADRAIVDGVGAHRIHAPAASARAERDDRP